MRLYFFYTMVQKSQKWPKIQIKGGGSCLKGFRLPDDTKTPREMFSELAVCWHRRQPWKVARSIERFVVASGQGCQKNVGVLLIFFVSFLWHFNGKKSLQSLSSVFQGLFSVKIRKMALGNDDLSLLPDPLGALWQSTLKTLMAAVFQHLKCNTHCNILLHVHACWLCPKKKVYKTLYCLGWSLCSNECSFEGGGR